VAALTRWLPAELLEEPATSPLGREDSQPRPFNGPTDDFPRRADLYTNADSREADAMGKLTFGMNLSLDGYIAAPGTAERGW
jgi:hypothetical protein